MKNKTDKLPISRQLELLSSTLGAVTLQLRQIARELTVKETKSKTQRKKSGGWPKIL